MHRARCSLREKMAPTRAFHIMNRRHLPRELLPFTATLLRPCYTSAFLSISFYLPFSREPSSWFIFLSSCTSRSMPTNCVAHLLLVPLSYFHQKHFEKPSSGEWRITTLVRRKYNPILAEISSKMLPRADAFVTPIATRRVFRDRPRCASARILVDPFLPRGAPSFVPDARTGGNCRAPRNIPSPTLYRQPRRSTRARRSLSGSAKPPGQLSGLSILPIGPPLSLAANRTRARQRSRTVL